MKIKRVKALELFWLQLKPEELLRRHETLHTTPNGVYLCDKEGAEALLKGDIFRR